MKTIKTIINKLFSAKPEQSPKKEYYFRVYRWMAKHGTRIYAHKFNMDILL